MEQFYKADFIWAKCDSDENWKRLDNPGKK